MAVLKYFLWLIWATLIATGLMISRGAFTWPTFGVTAVILALVILLHRALGVYLEYWVMKRMAKKFGVDLETFAQVRYEKKLSLNTIQMREDYFRSELEKRKVLERSS